MAERAGLWRGLNRKGEPVWVCPAFEKERAQELVPTGQEVRAWEEHENPYAVIGGILTDIGVGPGRWARRRTSGPLRFTVCAGTRAPWNWPTARP